MLDKPGAQNIVLFEKQGKWSKFSDHWKSIKTLFLKKNNRRWHKKDQKIDWNTSINKRFCTQ